MKSTFSEIYSEPPLLVILPSYLEVITHMIFSLIAILNRSYEKFTECYAVKKVFVNFFAKFFEVFAKFFKVFASFLRFSRAFRGFRIHSDPLGCIRMHSEAIGSVWTFSKIFEIFWIFESFFNVSGRNFYKRLFSRHNMPGQPNRCLDYRSQKQQR